MIEFERFMYGIFGSYTYLWMPIALLGLSLGFLFAFSNYYLWQTMRYQSRIKTGQMVLVVSIAVISFVLVAFAISVIIYRVPEDIPMTPSLVLEDIGVVDDYEVGCTGSWTWAKTKQGRYKISSTDHMLAGTPAYLTEKYYNPYICFEGENRCYRSYSSVTYSNKL